jgi:transposase
VPWAETGSRFTELFEDLVAYLAQATDKTHVSRLVGIAWASVGTIVTRVVARCQDPARLEGLRRIGIDEFSYRKHHRYLTLVVDHERRRVVWAGKGRSSESLTPFFEELGEEGRARVEVATIDMAQGYIKAIQDNLPNARIVFDRFHVQKLAGDAVDEVRRGIQRQGKGTEQEKALRKSRYALLKSPWDLSPVEREKLASVQQANRPLFRAYLLKETLREALNYKQPWRARRALKSWLAWASRSKLAPFVRVGRTIRKHIEGVMAYVSERLTNGIVEGINNRLRVIARRAYGFHSPGPLIAMLFLCCGGIELDPPLPVPT